jgi:hypothetical protein
MINFFSMYGKKFCLNWKLNGIFSEFSFFNQICLFWGNFCWFFCNFFPEQ